MEANKDDSLHPGHHHLDDSDQQLRVLLKHGQEAVHGEAEHHAVHPGLGLDGSEGVRVTREDINEAQEAGQGLPGPDLLDERGPRLVRAGHIELAGLDDEDELVRVPDPEEIL